MRGILVALIHLSLVYATPSASFRIQETQKIVPQGFTSVGPAPPERTISLRLALAQPDDSGIVDAHYSVSNPSSSKYGQYLSKHEASRPTIIYLVALLSPRTLWSG